MLRRVVALSCTVLVVITLSDANPARAEPSADLHVAVAHESEPATAYLCGYFFDYAQRITIDGDSMMAPITSVALPGYYEAILWDTCDGYDIYAFGSCLCHVVAVER